MTNPVQRHRPANQGFATGESIMGIRYKDLPENVQRRIGVSETPKRAKYGAVPTIIDGIRFASKKEAAYYDVLKLRQRAGEIDFFLMQVPFALPGGVRYRADFVTFQSAHAGRDCNSFQIEVIDCKGFKTPEYKLKAKQVKALYGITVKEI